MSTAVLFQTTQFSISTQFSSIWPRDRTLICATTLGQSASGRDSNKEVLHIPQSSGNTGTSSLHFLCHIQDTRLWDLTPLQRSSQCIWQLQPTRQWKTRVQSQVDSKNGTGCNFCLMLSIIREREYHPSLQHNAVAREKQAFRSPLTTVANLLIIIIIIIIMSHCQHGLPWPSLTTRLYCPLFLGGLQGYILYHYRAVVYRF